MTTSPQHLVSWNVNGIRAIQNKGFLDWLQATAPDVVCLQETKARPDQLDIALLSPPGYQTHWASAKKAGYSGVAVFSKIKPLAVETFGIPEFDDEGRLLVLEFAGYTLFNGYFPNSQEAGARLDYKLRYCEALLQRLEARVNAGRHVVVCGDYNIAHRPIDLANPKQNEGNPGYLPEERAWMDRFLAQGYADTFRLFNQEPHHYSWWSPRSQARERNVGWRIDYFCCDRGFIPQLQEAAIHPAIMGSDHCPVSLTLKP
jgi:exodeoxyribonuclease-3